MSEQPARLSSQQSFWPFPLHINPWYTPAQLEVVLQGHLDKTPPGHPDRRVYLSEMSGVLRRRYQETGDLQDLDAAIQKIEEALGVIPADHPAQPIYLNDLSKSLSERYRRFGRLRDLEAALENDKKVLELTQKEDNERPRRISCLATTLMTRYTRLGDLGDLEAALQRCQEVVDLTHPSDINRPDYLERLADALDRRFRRLGGQEDFDRGSQLSQEAHHITVTDFRLRGGPPDNHRDATRLRGLADSMLYQSKTLKDIEDAVQKAREAVNIITSANAPERARCLHSLSVALGHRYSILKDPQDIEESIESSREAVELTPADSSDRAARLQHLARFLQIRYRMSRHPRDMQAVHLAYNESFNTQAPPSNPEASWKAALQWALFSMEFQPARCPAAYSAAFRFLSDLMWMGHDIPVRQEALRRLKIGPVTSQATEACIKFSNLTSAIEIMEQGLGTIFQQILQLKTDTDELPVEQAKQLQELSYKLYSGTTDDASKVARQRQELLEEIRSQPGLKFFLLPKPYKVLCQASQGGPVIILNSGFYSSDGIIILNPTSEPVHVPLPKATTNELKRHRSSLKELLERCNVRTRGDSAATRLFGGPEVFSSKTTEQCFAEMLTWLWTRVVSPVYKALNSHGIHEGRLWWLATGEFAGLPLHACPPTNQFIPSYTATLGSLLEAYSKNSSSITPKLGVVGVTHTGPGMKNHLKGVAQEVRRIRSVVSNPQCLEGEQATPDAVKLQLRDCSWVHLACHGKQDLFEPTKSHLKLYGGILELDTILKMPLDNAQFVFLAACQTAMGDTELINESFHLGGGFLAAGFRGAIGTLWSMNDADGPLVAESVYSHLFKNGRKPQAGDAAKALQLAVNELKTRKVDYERWIPFIHMGV
ncbi:CHAT domain-containing protein [Mycena latifolia]|nr:CHAT domain-containing protein [Mycena latifolia]